MAKFQQNEDGTVVQFMHPNMVEDFMSRNVDVNTWIQEVKSYVFEANGNLIADRKLIYTMESQTFKTNTDPARRVTVIVSVFKFMQSL